LEPQSVLDELLFQAMKDVEELQGSLPPLLAGDIGQKLMNTDRH